MEAFLSQDTSLFFYINHLPHTTFLDTFMLLVSGIGAGGIIFIILGILLIIREEKRDHWFLVSLVFTGIIGWILSHELLKNSIARLRPIDLPGTNVVGIPPESFSFPSTHATLAFAFAYLLSVKEPRWRGWLYTLAGIIAFSRMYLGYHYPLDVLSGIAFGFGIGFIVRFIFSVKKG